MLKGKYYCSPIGQMLIVCENDSLIGIWFENQKYYKNKINDNISFDNNTICDKFIKYLDDYFAGKIQKIDLIELKPKGTKFQIDVWDELLKIPYGTTKTYSEIAATLAKNDNMRKMSSRAVGAAIGKNPISILIPCHRVIGKNGSLTGYASGIDRKKWLLEFEIKHKK